MGTQINGKLVVREATAEDIETLANICFEAFAGINRAHGYEPDFPDVSVTRGLMQFLTATPGFYGVVAELDGRVVGSNFMLETGTIAGIGPITVDPAVQEQSVGRLLMERVLERARERQFVGVRLVQGAFNRRSMALYTKLGFDVREPLVCLQGTVRPERIPDHVVRPMTEGDLDACGELCTRVHGFGRNDELYPAIAQGTARVAVRDGQVVAYASDVAFFGHMVAAENSGLIALINAAERIGGPGFLLPSRNGDAFRWCLSHGLRVMLPMTLMSIGLYNEPRGAFVPSILF